MNELLKVTQEYIQYGFAGFAFCLLIVVVWQIWGQRSDRKELIEVINRSNSVQAKLIDMIKMSERTNSDIKEKQAEIKNEIVKMKDEFLRRPCMASRRSL